MNTVLKRTLLSSLVVPFALAAQSASAVEITNWGYSVTNEFSNAQFNGGGGGGTTVEETNSLSWGNSDLSETEDRSSVSINNVSEDSGLMTNGGFVDGGTFVHDNNVIDASYATLTGFDLTSTLTLTAYAPNTGDSETLAPLTFNNSFIETLNREGECFTGSNSVCDDIFTIDNLGEGLEPNGNGWFELAATPFTIDDYTYTVFLELQFLAPLGDTCAVAGAPDGCIGLVTEEGSVNNFDTRFRIASAPASVPEPGTLALLGLGIAGLGLSRRRKAAKA